MTLRDLLSLGGFVLLVSMSDLAFAQEACPGKPNAHVISRTETPQPDGTIKRTTRCECNAGYEARGGACVAAESCARLEAQLERDKEAVRRQQRTIGLGREELEEWTKRNEEAEKKALEAGFELLLTSFTQDLDRLAKSASAYKGWVTRYAKAAKRVRNPERFQRAVQKLDGAMRQYDVVRARVDAGRGLKVALTAKDHWDAFRGQLGASVQDLVTTNEDVRAATAELRALLGDEAFDDIRPDVDRDLVIAKEVIEEVGTRFFAERYARVFGPSAALGKFIVDYGYNATQWWQSRQRILQQYDLSDQALRAVDALKEQIERTTEALNRCRAEHR